MSKIIEATKTRQNLADGFYYTKQGNIPGSQLWREEIANLQNQFKKDVLSELKLDEYPKVDALYEYVWKTHELDNDFGFGSVINHLEQIAEFVRPEAPKEFKISAKSQMAEDRARYFEELDNLKDDQR